MEVVSSTKEVKDGNGIRVRRCRSAALEAGEAEPESQPEPQLEPAPWKAPVAWKY